MKFWKLSFISLIFLGLYSTNGLSQINDNWVIRWIKPKENQFFQQTIYSVAQDSMGFIWFGTENDLIRYDGYDYKIFHFDAKNPNSVQFSSYSALLVDKEGFLWVGSTQDGLSRFDPILDRFDHFFKSSISPNRLLSNYITTLFQSKSGSIWVGTDRGLHRLDQNPDSSWNIQIFQHQAKDPTTISQNIITSIVEDTQGSLWIGTFNGLNQLNPDSGTFTRYDNTTKIDGPSNNHVTSLCLDKQKMLWIGTKNGLCKLNMDTHHFSPLFSETNDSISISQNHITDIHIDHHGKLWLTTQSTGLTQFDPLTGVSNHFQAHADIEPSLQSNHLTCVLIDKMNRIWAGGQRLNFLFQRKQKIQYFDIHQLINLQTPDFQVRSFYQDSAMHLWIGTSHGLFELNWNPAEDYSNNKSYIVENHFGSVTNSTGMLPWLYGSSGIL
ncbi:MAG: two-component regulator propeller domain-containing protein [Bacteroidota bacterium]